MSENAFGLEVKLLSQKLNGRIDVFTRMATDGVCSIGHYVGVLYIRRYF
jgi:hypothetical protein